MGKQKNILIKKKQKEILDRNGEPLSDEAKELFREQAPKPMHLEGHRPITRRDFISQGFISGAGVAIVPTFLGVALQSQLAQAALECGSGSGGGQLAKCLIIDAAGGMNIASNIAPRSGSNASQPLQPAGYSALGMGPGRSPIDSPANIVNFGGLEFRTQGGIIQGIQQELALASVNFEPGTSVAAVAAQSGDDTSNNPYNVASLIAGVQGLAGSPADFVKVAGSQNSMSGGNSDSLYANSAYTSVRVATPGSAAALVDIPNLSALFANNKSLLQTALSKIAGLSELQVNRFPSAKLSDAAKNLIGCSHLGAAGFINGSNSPDPTTDPDLVTIWQNFNGGDNQKFGTGMNLLMKNIAGVYTGTVGGADYHDGTSTTGAAFDLNIGRIIGRALRTAAVKAQPLFIVLITDGSTSTNGQVGGNGDLVWNSDRGNAGTALVFAYRPGSRVAMNSSVWANQIMGPYSATNGGVIASGSPWGNNVQKAAELFVVNYLLFNGLSPTLHKSLAGTMSNAEIAQAAMFGSWKT